MALKSEKWFFRQCYQQVRRLTNLAHLANRALELGFGREQTGGHIRQACGAVQLFLEQFPQHVNTIRSSSATDPFRVQGQIRRNWLNFFRNKTGNYGQRKFGYSWDTLRGYLTRRYGGKRTGGGGGDNEFEIVLRLMAEFL